jgi:DNA polymerase III delta subunit
VDARAGWSAGITCFTGDDVYHLDAALKAVVAAVVADPGDPFALTIFSDGKISAAELAGAARSRGMFASARVVLLRDVGILEGEPDALRAFAAEPPEGGYLLVRAPRLDRKRKLHQALLAGRVLEFRSPANAAELSELLREIAALAREREVKLAASAVSFLAEACENDLVRIVSELDKIRDWAPQGGGAVDAEALRAIVMSGDVMTGWELAEHVLARDGERALATARRYANSGEEAIKIVGGLAWRARTMLQAKALADAGARPDEIVQAARAWNYREALLAGIRRYTLAELLAFPARLLAADRALKSRQIAPGAVLEALVDDLTAAGSGRQGTP